MSARDPRFDRPAAYELDSYGWNLRRVPQIARIGDQDETHPSRRCAIFVVHGMGEQQWTQTGASLRSGSEDALDVIRKWQKENLAPEKVIVGAVPPPFMYEGYWANYADLKATFPEDWEQFNERERTFFQHLWDTRSYSAMRTYMWFLGQQLQLIDPRHIKKIGFAVWLLYWPLQIIFPAALTVALLRKPKIITRILADVRLYANPRGIAERALIQRIDYRVGREFLRLIGLDWDFRPLSRAEQVVASGTPFIFNRVVWVAHSLGSVVSYNVLSDLFSRAAQLEHSGDVAQRRGVVKFRESLCRFVTLGSPLNKFASLFPEALRPWNVGDRSTLVTGGEVVTDGSSEGDPDGSASDSRELWINYYNVLDPVSGALYNPLICGATPPVNIHTNWRASALLPGLAHTSYWCATTVLRFILARAYGCKYLPDQAVERQSIKKQMWFAVIGYFVWAILMFGGVILLFVYRTKILRALWEVLKAAGRFLIGA